MFENRHHVIRRRAVAEAGRIALAAERAAVTYAASSPITGRIERGLHGQASNDATLPSFSASATQCAPGVPPGKSACIHAGHDPGLLIPAVASGGGSKGAPRHGEPARRCDAARPVQPFIALGRGATPRVTHVRAFPGTHRHSHCICRRPRTVQRHPHRSVSGTATRAGYRQRAVKDARATRWCASATRRTATGANCAYRRRRPPSKTAAQGRFRAGSFEGSSSAAAPGAGAADSGSSARGRIGRSGFMPGGHRGCRKRHFHWRRRADSQDGGRCGSRGRRRGR